MASGQDISRQSDRCLGQWSPAFVIPHFTLDLCWTSDTVVASGHLVATSTPTQHSTCAGRTDGY